LEEELTTIERLVKRVEQAHQDGNYLKGTENSYAGILVTSVASGLQPVEAVPAPKAALMVELIQEFSEISGTIDRISSKMVSVKVDFPTNDFPKEISERLEIINRCDRYSHALSVKDHMLWTTIQERERFIELLEEEKKMSQEYAQEVAKWAELSQTLTSTVKALTAERDKLSHTNKDLINALRENNIFYVPS